MTLLYRDDRFLLHQTGSHPECPQRLRAIHDRLDQSGLLERCTTQTVVAALDNDLLRVHPAWHLDRIREFADTGGGRIEVDTVMSPASALVKRVSPSTILERRCTSSNCWPMRSR